VRSAKERKISIVITVDEFRYIHPTRKRAATGKIYGRPSSGHSNFLKVCLYR